MSSRTTHPSWRISTIILVSISLSIGWGVRGNFGHEYGAMLPGMLAAVAVCLASGRDDWRRRVAYFAFFGAMGWAFGGSMSYMKVVSYTHSGHFPSQLYGFFGLFAGGFLWSALGGAGTAYPAVEERDRLTALFRPLCWVLLVWTAYYFLWEPVWKHFGVFVVGPERGLDREMRQNDPFYWLDSDWVPAFLALLAVCAFDLWDRRFDKVWALGGLGILGALIGGAVQLVLTKVGLLDKVLPYIVRIQGDLTVTNPDTGLPFDPNNMVTNWPQLFIDYAGYLGVAFGLLIGAAIYFAVWGKWCSGASLLMHMIVGWFVVFLVFPVLLGVRMTPPRNDNWAGCLGVWLGIVLYTCRNKLLPVALASIVCGTIGGFGIAATQCLKLMLVAPGNPYRLADLPATFKDPIIKAWAHWQAANWHSIVIEQGVGLIYGVGVAVAMAMLAARLRRVSDDPPVRRWTEVFSVGFLLTALVYVNMVKNTTEFTKDRLAGSSSGASYRCMPLTMKMPLIESIELSTRTWFNLFFLLLSVCIIVLLAVHMRRRLAFVPTSWLGKGQLLYLVFLWIVVVFNFEKALVGFGEQRLATEGIIFVNAVIATFMVAYFLCDHEPEAIPKETDVNVRRLLIRAIMICIAVGTFSTIVFTGDVRAIYKNKFAGHAGNRGIRFGERAEWRLYPVLKDIEHR